MLFVLALLCRGDVVETWRIASLSWTEALASDVLWVPSIPFLPIGMELYFLLFCHVTTDWHDLSLSPSTGSTTLFVSLLGTFLGGLFRK